MVSPVDDPGYADGRWLAVVWIGDAAVDRRRTAEVFRRRSSGERGGYRHFRFQNFEETQPTSAALSIGAALLVQGPATRPVLLSLGPHHDGVFGRVGGELLLSVTGRSVILPGDQHRGFPHRAGNAFPERRAGRRGSGPRAGVRFDYDVCVARLALANKAREDWKRF